MSEPDEAPAPAPDEIRRRHFSDGPNGFSPEAKTKHAIADEVRKLIESVALIDSETSSEEDLGVVLAEARRLRESCELLPSLRAYGSPMGAPGHASSLFERSPITGLANALAAPLYLERRDDGKTVGHATYGSAFEGPPGSLHGGMVAAAFDELLGVAQWASSMVGMTGTLTIKMMSPTPLGSRIDYEGEVERTEGRKIFLRGKSFADGKQLAEAEGIYISFLGHPQLGSP